LDVAKEHYGREEITEEEFDQIKGDLSQFGMRWCKMSTEDKGYGNCPKAVE